MPSQFRVRVIPTVPDKLLKKFKPEQIAKAVEEAKQEEAEQVKEEFEKTVRTWNHKPDFKIRKWKDRLVISTDDPIYGYVTHGTKVRRAVMSKDFKSKTKPNWISSRKGKGGVVFISKKIKLPGIEARNFDKILAERCKARFQKRLRKKLQEMLA